MKGLKSVSASLAIAGVLLSSGCNSGASQAAAASKAETPATAPVSSNPLEIQVEPDLVLQIKVGEPAWRNVSDELNVAGRIEADETRMARISAPVTGRLVELNVTEGQIVQKGQVVATIYSTDLAASQSAFLKAYSQYQLSERAVARARQLLDAGVIGAAELQRREAEAQQDSVDLASSRKQLSVLGVPEESIQKLETSHAIDSTTQVVAAVSGQVIERLVTPGQIVQGAEAICVVADMSNVWLIADVPEQSAYQLHVSQPLQAEIPALPNNKIRGIISFVSPTVDKETRTIRARMNLPNPDFRYKPLMLANVKLLGAAERRLTVPTPALVRDGDDVGVFVQLEPNKFVLRPVMLGNEFEGQSVILEGIDPSDKIVVEGSFHLNNERRRQIASGNSGA